jgi:hypothetical protein
MAASVLAPAASAGIVNDQLQQWSPDFKPWDIGGQVRFRYEIQQGAGPNVPTIHDFSEKFADNAAHLFLGREFVHVGYKQDWFGAYAEFRDSWENGRLAARGTTSDRTELGQAYIMLGSTNHFPVTLKVGRQEFIYGDERLIGASDWSNVPRMFDAAKLRYERPGLWIDAFVSRVLLVNDQQFDHPDWHDWFSGIYGSTTLLCPYQNTEFYVLGRDSGKGAAVSPRDVVTVGTRWKSIPGKLGPWDYEVEAMGQLGSINSGGATPKRLDQQAYAIHLDGGYTFKQAWATPRLNVEYNFSPGDSDSKDGVSGTIDPLFPTNHKFYGLVDVMSWRNAHNLRLGTTLKPVAKLTVTADYQFYWLADTHDFFYPQSGAGRSGNGYGIHPDYTPYLGSEFDIQASYAFKSWAAFRAGYGHFFAGSYLRQSLAATGGTKDADWIYAMTTLTF